MDINPHLGLLLIFKNKLAEEAAQSPLDEKLVDRILISNDPMIFSLALCRDDCPSALLVELSLSPIEKIRELVVAHANTPLSVVRQMVNDPNPEIAVAAKNRLSPGVLIVEQEKFNRH